MKLTHDEAVDFFATLYGGRHHIPGGKYKGDNVKSWGPNAWQVAHYGDLATYDFDLLTRLVLLAHERCIRVGIQPCGPRHVRIGISRRERTDSIFTNHPTIEQALASFAKLKGAPR